MFGASLVGIGERMRECVSVLEVEEVQFYCQFCTSNEAGLGEPMSRASAQRESNGNVLERLLQYAHAQTYVF